MDTNHGKDRACEVFASRASRRRLVQGLGVLTLGGLLGGASWSGTNAQEATPDPTSEPADGQLDVGGGRKLHLYCTGAGSPTVVLDAGLGNDWSSWRLVQPRVAAFTRVCAYDRAGLGESDPAPAGPCTSADAVADLHALLGAVGRRGPYVLVGHSSGGHNVRLFAATYPGEVAGLVLVDAVHEDYFDRLHAVDAAQTKALVEVLASEPEQLDFAASNEQLRAAGPLPAVPTVVITRGVPDFPPLAPTEATEALWQELQRDLASRVPNARLVVAERSGHNVFREQPELIADAARQVVEAIRNPGSWATPSV